MEDKIIKVRCINTLNFKELTINKEYPVIEEEPQGYKIINDYESIRRYHKSLFEKVKNVLMVECIDISINPKDLTLNKKYKVMDQNEECYLIRDDAEEWAQYSKSRFKLVEPQKEVKEYTVMELLDFPVGTKFKDEDGCLVEIAILEDAVNEKKIIFSCEDENGGLEITTIWRDMKFTLKEESKPVSTAEAFKALEEGKIIESKITKDQYKKDVKLYIKLYTEQEKGFGRCINISSLEIEGQWIIHE